MSARVTRSTRSQSKNDVQRSNEQPQQLSSPPATPIPATRTKRGAKGEHLATPKANSTSSSKKRTRGVKAEDEDELPHNLGRLVPPTPAVEDGDGQDQERNYVEASPKKRRGANKELTRKESPMLRPKEDPEMQSLALVNKIGFADSFTQDSPAKKPKAKEHSLTPGVTPYPSWPHPTPEECQEVTDILSKLHGKVQQPEKPPPPSLTVAGCGEVPSVLDALIRTCLSANTSNTNSNRAFQGLKDRFGILQAGVGKGSINYDAVRRASASDVEKAIHAGGLSVRKSQYIKGILDKVYVENQERAAKLRDPSNNPAGAEQESEGEKNLEVARAEQGVLSLDHLHLLSDEEAFKKLSSFNGIGAKTASCVLLFCLKRPSFAVDTHVFRLSRWLGWVPPQDWVDEQNAKSQEMEGDQVDNADVGSPIKKKRKVKNRGMPRVDRDTCFAHCETRVPDHLKYALHYLLIKHGKTCPRCRAVTGESSKDWDKGCVIDKLVKRDGVRKGRAAADDLSDHSEADEWQEDDQHD